jgi:hypothetical protein
METVENASDAIGEKKMPSNTAYNEVYFRPWGLFGLNQALKYVQNLTYVQQPFNPSSRVR